MIEFSLPLKLVRVCFNFLLQLSFFFFKEMDLYFNSHKTEKPRSCKIIELNLTFSRQKLLAVNVQVADLVNITTALTINCICSKMKSYLHRHHLLLQAIQRHLIMVDRQAVT